MADGMIGSRPSFFQSIAPALHGAFTSLGQTGDLSRQGQFTAQFQQAQGQQQLRDLQTQAAQQRLADAERARQQEAATMEAFRALPPGIFGSGGEALRTVAASDPALRRSLLVQATKPAPAVAPETLLQAAQRKKIEQQTANLALPGAGKPATAAERKVGNFVGRMFQAEDRLRKLGPQVESSLTMNLPAGLARRTRSRQQQLYRQAAMQWIRANLRKESGAVIGADEAEEEFATYFPVAGDGPEVIAQKQQARLEILQGVKGEAGRGFSATGAEQRLQATLQRNEQRALKAQAARQKEQERVRRKMETGQELSAGQRQRLQDGSVIEEDGQFKIKTGGRFVLAQQNPDGTFTPVAPTQRRARIGFN